MPSRHVATAPRGPRRTDVATSRPPRSRWNLYIEALLAADLTAAEYRLALALMRLILGYRLAERDLGDRLLRKTAGTKDGRTLAMDGRTFARARAGLVAKGLLVYRPGVPGGGRSHYALAESGHPLPAAERAQVTAVERSQLPAQARARREVSREAMREDVLEKYSAPLAGEQAESFGDGRASAREVAA